MMAPLASRVCMVENTRWPVSAADSAICAVSRSRISPTRMTSGSCRRPCFRPALKDGTSRPTSRCVTIEPGHLGNWYSTGSSIVMMRQLPPRLSRVMIMASVVVLPEPATPVSRTRPLRNWASRWANPSGKPAHLNVGIVDGIKRKHAPMFCWLKKKLARKRRHRPASSISNEKSRSFRSRNTSNNPSGQSEASMSAIVSPSSGCSAIGLSRPCCRQVGGSPATMCKSEAPACTAASSKSLIRGWVSFIRFVSNRHPVRRHCFTVYSGKCNPGCVLLSGVRTAGSAHSGGRPCQAI